MNRQYNRVVNLPVDTRDSILGISNGYFGGYTGQYIEE